MKTQNVTKAKKRNDGSIDLIITDPFNPGHVERERYSGIRGGIFFPSKRAHAYCCILGQLHEDTDNRNNKKKEGKLILLAEYSSESFSLSKFYQQITDASEQFYCRDFHTIVPENYHDRGFISDFEDFARERKSKCYLHNAYDADNFMVGMSRIRESSDSGRLIVAPDSFALSELQTIEKEDLLDHPEERFPEINALRHVLSSFYRDPPNNHEIITRVRRGRGSAMAA